MSKKMDRVANDKQDYDPDSATKTSFILDWNTT